MGCSIVIIMNYSSNSVFEDDTLEATMMHKQTYKNTQGSKMSIQQTQWNRVLCNTKYTHILKYALQLHSRILLQRKLFNLHKTCIHYYMHQ